MCPTLDPGLSSPIAQTKISCPAQSRPREAVSNCICSKGVDGPRTSTCGRQEPHSPRTKNHKATYPIIIVLVARHHSPVPDHTFNLSQRISGQIRCFVAFRERTPIDEIVSDPMAHPIQAEKVWTFENAIPNSRGQIQVAEEERKRLCFGCPMPDPEVRIVER